MIVQVVSGKLKAYESETISVDNTAGGKALTATKYKKTSSLADRDEGPARSVLMTVHLGDIRWTIDGTPPVAATTGHLAPVGSVLEFANYQAMVTFRAIRDTGTSGELYVTYMR